MAQRIHPNSLKPIKKGEVRNPRGKARGTLNFTTILKKLLKQDNNSTALMTKLIQSGLNGNIKAINMIMDNNR